MKKCPPGQYYCFTDKKCKEDPVRVTMWVEEVCLKKMPKKVKPRKTVMVATDYGNGNGNGANGSGNGGW